jgi:cell division GTPase FtsZ
MSAISKTETDKPEELVDDVSSEKVSEQDKPVDQNKMAELKAKSQAKQQEQKMAAKIVSKKDRSLALGIIGSGQAGSRLAEAFYKLGYDAVVMNTASQDLKFIDLPDTNKLLLDKHAPIGGAARELSIGEAAASAHRGEILQMLNEKLGDSQVNVLCTSLGGGSGAGSCGVLIDLLASVGKPIVVITVLPSDSEDAKVKSNALETLSSLLKMAQKKIISNLIVADNAKIESIYRDVSPVDFYGVANKAIISVLDTFNTLSSTPSPMKPLDSAEMTKLLIDSDGFSIYGELTITNFAEETAIAESIIGNLSDNLLAGGFDLKQTKHAGFMVVANKSVWDQIPKASIDYAESMVRDLCGSSQVFKGFYVADMLENVVKIYSFFNGLGLPVSRTEQLRKEAAELQSHTKTKDDTRKMTLELDTGTNETVSQAQKIKEKIAAKSSAFGKLMGGTVDRRK